MEEVTPELFSLVKDLISLAAIFVATCYSVEFVKYTRREVLIVEENHEDRSVFVGCSYQRSFKIDLLLLSLETLLNLLHLQEVNLSI